MERYKEALEDVEKLLKLNPNHRKGKDLYNIITDK